MRAAQAAHGVRRTAMWRGLSTARRAVRQAAERCHPVRRTLRWSQPPTSAVTVLSVYRRRNADALAAVLATLPDDWNVSLWGLDGVAPRLAGRTIGHGPGGRLALFNGMLAQIAPQQRRNGLVLLDDDCRFVVGGLPALLATGSALGLDVYQAAHSSLSHCGYEAVRRRRGLVARTTGFVEQGPVVVLSRAAQQLLLPFGTLSPMGWGEDVRWSCEAHRAGLVMGIVDSVCLQHRERPATSYDRTAEEEQLQEALQRAGVTCLADLQSDRTAIRPAELRQRTSAR